MSKKITYRCPECGSHDVYGSAFTKWDIAAQAWVIENEDDIIRCSECDHDTNCDWEKFEVELGPNVLATEPLTWHARFETDTQGDIVWCVRDQTDRLICDMPKAPDSEDTARKIAFFFNLYHRSTHEITSFLNLNQSAEVQS